MFYPLQQRPDNGDPDGQGDDDGQNERGPVERLGGLARLVIGGMVGDTVLTVDGFIAARCACVLAIVEFSHDICSLFVSYEQRGIEQPRAERPSVSVVRFNALRFLHPISELFHDRPFGPACRVCLGLIHRRW